MTTEPDDKDRAGPRFLFITHSAAPSGAELLLLRLVAGLAPHAAVLAMEEGPLVDELRAQGTPIEVLPLAPAVREVRREAGASGSLRLLPEIVRLLPRLAARRSRHAVTVAFSQKAFVVAALSQPLVRLPLVWGLNDIISSEHFSASMRQLTVTLANRAVRRVVVNSKATGAAFIAAGGRPALSLVIHPGIDLRSYGREAAPDAASTRLRVGSFGRLAAWKGQDVLLRALVHAPQVEAWIVGAAQFGERAYAQHLERQARELGVADRVRFLGHRDDVPSLMAACDVIAHTSTAAEPFGQVIVEGLACAKPVIATAAGGALEIIAHEVNGLLVPPGDAAALAAALRRLETSPELRGRLAAAGPSAAAAFSTSAMVEAWSRCLDSLLTSRTYVTGTEEIRERPSIGAMCI